MTTYGIGKYSTGIYGGGTSYSTTITQSTLYGSRRYENLVLGHLPSALFGSYNSTTNSIDDETNNEMLSATLASSAVVNNQIPFFALPDLNYTFNIATSNAITISESTASYSNSTGIGKFSNGDENSAFSFEFLFSHNFGLTSDIVRFGTSSSSPQMKIYYASNAFVLDVYGEMNSNRVLSSGTKLRYRSVVVDPDIEASRHIVVVFVGNKPKFYIDGKQANVVIDELTNQVFFDLKTSNRTIAVFDGGSSAKALVSMIALYDYALTDNMIMTHYKTAKNIEDMTDYPSNYGSILKTGTNSIVQISQRNTDNSLDLMGTNIYNTTYKNNYVVVNNAPTWQQYGTSNDYLQIPQSGYGIKYLNFSSNFDLINDKLIVTFQGKSTSGSYTSQQCLFYIENIVINGMADSLYAGINASAQLFIESASLGTLATSTATIPKTSRKVVIDFSASGIYLDDLTSGASASASLTSLSINGANAYFYNGYYTSSATGLITERGNSEIDVANGKFGTNYHTAQHIPYLSKEGFLQYIVQTDSVGRINAQILSSSYTNHFFRTQGSQNSSYTLITDSASQTLLNNSIVTTASSASSTALEIDLISSTMFGGGKFDFFKFISTGSFTSANGAYDAYFVNSNGLNLTDKDIFILDKQNMIGYSNKSNSITYATRSSQTYTGIISSSNTTTTITGLPSTIGLQAGAFIMSSSGPGAFGGNASIVSIDSSTQITISSTSANTAGSVTLYQNPMGQFDFLISIPDTLTASSQYLLFFNAASYIFLGYTSSVAYTITFSGMTASINNSSITSGVTTLSPRQTYFVQTSLNFPVPDSSSVYLMGGPSGTRFLHSFTNITAYPYGTSNLSTRYAQVFGRKNFMITDNTVPYLNICSIPENVTAYNKTWQSFGN